MPAPRHILTFFLALLSMSLAGHVVFAQEATSSGFTMRNSTLNTLGGSGTSTNFFELQSGNQVGGGESTSTSFLLDTGFLYYDNFTPKQQNWRWYDDETNETPTVPLSNENVAPSSLSTGNIIKLRVSVAEIAGIGAQNVKYRLQYSVTSDFSSGVYDVVEALNCLGSSVWCYKNSAGLDNQIITTGVISDSGSCAGSVGLGCGTHNESGTTTTTFTHQKNATTEFEFTIQESGSAANTVYFFRLKNISSGAVVPFNNGKSYPSLSSSATTLDFTIGGISSSTMTSGTTTTLDTTSTNIPFGALTGGSSAVGAQRLTVTTNATQGYEIFSYALQGFVGSGSEIPPIQGTNRTPLGWNAGCLLAVSGCYGYHTSEAVLSGGSTRFAANDTFAKFSTTTLDEVAYSVGPVSNKSTDIVYKTEIHGDQPADSYSTNVVYIVVPTF